MLLDPFEEQFDLPASAIELGNGQRRDGEVVGQEDERFAGFGVAIADAPQGVGLIVLGLQAGHHDGLVEPQAGGFVHGTGVTTGTAEVLPGTGDEESAALMNPMPPGEVKVAAIHDIERAGLADAGVIELRAEGRQTGFDVAQTFAPRQLGERQHEELFVGGQLADAEVAVVTGDTLVEFVFGEEVEELCEDGATFVHKVKNRQPAVEHLQQVVAKLKSKNDRTTRKRRFY
jgi:hypothetical protein